MIVFIGRVVRGQRITRIKKIVNNEGLFHIYIIYITDRGDCVIFEETEKLLNDDIRVTNLVTDPTFPVSFS